MSHDRANDMNHLSLRKYLLGWRCELSYNMNSELENGGSISQASGILTLPSTLLLSWVARPEVCSLGYLGHLTECT